MSLNLCEINFTITWYKNCVILTFTGPARFPIADAKPHVPVVTLSTHVNTNCHSNK